MKLEFKKFSRRKKSNRLGAITVLAAFLLNSVIGPGTPAFAQGALPLPGTMVKLTPGFAPVLIKGLRVYPENPLRFDFIVDPGDSGLQGEEFVGEAKKAMKYFLSSLTVPEKDLWVNLSPFEKDRIIPDKFGKTEMGRDMLGQDYILKQLSASLTYPETELGKKYWEQVNKSLVPGPSSLENVNQAPGTNHQEPSLNRVWIIPDRAVVYSKNNIAYVLESHLKVMMEEDFEKGTVPAFQGTVPFSGASENQGQSPKERGQSLIFRTLILPQIEKEVNEGENFAQLRQLYNSLILATWFKRNLKQSILSKVYVGQNKIDGVTFSDGTDKNKIYEGYLEAFKKGVYNIIKEDEDAATGETIPRKYFSGGIMAMATERILVERDEGNIGEHPGRQQLFIVQLGNPGGTGQSGSSVVVAGSGVRFRDERPIGKPKVLYRGKENKGFESVSDEKKAVAEFRKSIDELAHGADPDHAMLALRYLSPWIKNLTDHFAADLKEDPSAIEKQFDLLETQLLVLQRKVNADNQSLRSLNQEIEPISEQWRQLSPEKKSEPAAQELLVRIREIRKRIFKLEMQKDRESNELDKMRAQYNSLKILARKAELVRRFSEFQSGQRILTDTEARSLLEFAGFMTRVADDHFIGEVLAKAIKRLDAYLRVEFKDRNFMGWNNRLVRVGMNMPRLFSLESQALNIDIMPFMTMAAPAWAVGSQFDFIDPAVRVSRMDELAANGNHFVTSHRELVIEILKVLYFTENYADRYFGIGDKPIITGDLVKQSRLRAGFLRSLNTDGRNPRLTRLIWRLLSETQPGPGGTGLMPDIPGRIETALAYIKDNDDLRTQAELTEDYNNDDIKAIAKIYKGVTEQWFTATLFPVPLPQQEGVTEHSPQRIDPPPAVVQKELAAPANTAQSNPGQDLTGRAGGQNFDMVRAPGGYLPEDDTGDFDTAELLVKDLANSGRMGQRPPPIEDRGWNIDDGIFDDGIFDNTNRPNLLKRSIQGAVKFAKSVALVGAVAAMSLFGVAKIMNVDIANLIPTVNPPVAQTLAHLNINPQAMTPQAAIEYRKYPWIKANGEKSSNDYANLAGLDPLKGGVAIANANNMRNPALPIPADQPVILPNVEELNIRLLKDIHVDGLIMMIYGDRNFRTVSNFFESNRDVSFIGYVKSGTMIKVFVPTKDIPAVERRLEKIVAPGNPGAEPEATVPAPSDQGGIKDKQQVGGINLDPGGLVISETGEKFKFDVPIDPQVLQKLQQNPVNGFVPVILNIVPIGNLPQFLGISKAVNTQSPA